MGNARQERHLCSAALIAQIYSFSKDYENRLDFVLNDHYLLIAITLIVCVGGIKRMTGEH
jgi:hypothetical protein